MSTHSKTAAQIRAQFPALTDEVRNDASALKNSAARLGTLLRAAVGSPNQQTPKDTETFLEILLEEAGVLEDQADSANQRMHYCALLADQAALDNRVKKAAEDVVES